MVFNDVAPPDGVDVRVEIIPAADEAPSIWDKLKKYSGSVKGLPPDMARNHDHYIHGTPNRPR